MVRSAAAANQIIARRYPGALNSTIMLMWGYVGLAGRIVIRPKDR
jgi:hypothetical protein